VKAASVMVVGPLPAARVIVTPLLIGSLPAFFAIETMEA